MTNEPESFRPNTAWKPDIDTADHVFHRPTGETWLVAYAEGSFLSPCGWPNCLAKISDCTLVKKATPKERDKLLAEMAQPKDSEWNRDPRHLAAVRRLSTTEKEA